MIKTILFIGFLFFCFTQLVYAWGIAFPENEFAMKKGESVNITLSMQNYVESDTKKIIVSLDGDSKIAKILDKKDYYILPPKTKGYDVYLQINIPVKHAKKEYNLDVNFVAQSLDEGIGLASAKTIHFRITVPDGDFVNETPYEDKKSSGEELSEQSLNLQSKEKSKTSKKPGIIIPKKEIPLRSTSLLIGLTILIIIIYAVLQKRKQDRLRGLL